MPRVKRGTIHLKNRRALLKSRKGAKGRAGNLMRRASESSLKAGRSAYADRKKRKRNSRKLWNVKINAAVREQGMSYSEFIHALKEKQVELDRKVLADMAEHYPDLFKEVVKSVK